MSKSTQHKVYFTPCLSNIPAVGLFSKTWANKAFYYLNFMSQIINQMNTQDFTTTILVGQPPEKVFKAVINPRAWWSEEIEGNTATIDDVFIYHYEDIHRCKVKLIEVVPNKKVVWQILENNFNFTKDKMEWVNTKVSFEISGEGEKTQLVFTHIGLVSEYECFEACHQGWTHYIETSLCSLIQTGKGLPNAKNNPQTSTEKKLSSSNI